MLEVQRALRRRMGLATSVDAFERLYTDYSAHRAAQRRIQWRIPPGFSPEHAFGEHGPHHFEVHPDRFGKSRLSYHWASRGHRHLATLDDALTATRVAQRIVDVGGPFGGGEFDRLPAGALPRWQEALPPGEGKVIGFGLGFELRLRPMGDALHLLTLDSPAGPFRIAGIGSLEDMAFAACQLYLLADPWHDPMAPLDAPFHVHRGQDLIPVNESTWPGILGVAREEERELFLLLLDGGELALVEVDHAGKPRCLRRGSARELHGFDLRSLDPAGAHRPQRWQVEDVIAGLHGLPDLPFAPRLRLCEVVRASYKAAGADTVRKILWAIAVAVTRGSAGRITEKLQPLMQWLATAGDLPGIPEDSARRRAMGWLSEHCDFVEREHPRSHSWTIDLDLLLAAGATLRVVAP